VSIAKNNNYHRKWKNHPYTVTVRVVFSFTKECFMSDEELPRTYEQLTESFGDLIKEARSAGIDVVLLMRESSMFSQGTRVSFARNCDDIVAYGLTQFAYERVSVSEDEEDN
jgi:hypothetical protein